MTRPEQTLARIGDIGGYAGACIVDSESGMMLVGDGGGEVDLELAAAGNAEVVKAKRSTMRSPSLDDRIEDLLITLGRWAPSTREISVPAHAWNEGLAHSTAPSRSAGTTRVSASSIPW